MSRYKDAIVSLKAKVKETEGEDMQEAIQDKVRLLRSLNSVAGRPAACGQWHGFLLWSVIPVSM
jgi:hypothetical protein